MGVNIHKAKEILIEWKGDDYAFGIDVLAKTGEFAAAFGKKALLIVADLGLDWVEGL